MPTSGHSRLLPFAAVGFACQHVISIAGIAAILLAGNARSWAVDAKTSDERTRRFADIEKMSQLERERLQRNMAEFQQLPVEKQAHYRDLHFKLEENKSGGGQLSSLLQEYSAWLTTLTPSQREELSKETDPAKKLSLVRRIKEEQNRQPEAYTPSEPSIEFPLPPPHRPFGMALSRSELNALMNVIAKDLGRQEGEKSDRDSSPRAYLNLIQQSIEKTSGGAREWPSAELQQKLEKAIDRPEPPDILKRRQEHKREFTIRVILGSIQSLAMDELRQKLPRESDLHPILESLDREKREEITNLPREQGQRLLTMMYFKKKGDDTPHKMSEMQREFEQLYSDLGLPPRPQFGFGSRSWQGPPGPPRDGGEPGPDEGRPGFGDRGRRNGGLDRPNPRKQPDQQD